MKILKYTTLALVALCALISALTTKTPGLSGWIWQFTTILWVANYGVLTHISDLSDKVIDGYKELTDKLLAQNVRLKEELRQTQIQGKSVTRKK